MFIQFYMPCRDDLQKKLHRVFRHKIVEWRESRSVKSAVLTYHFKNPPDPDYLQLCLDIPAVKEPAEPKEEISQETKRQIPSVIMEHIEKVCQENRIELSITNYTSVIENASKDPKRQPYYDGAPVKEIIRFASVGTAIAFEILGQLEKRELVFSLEYGDLGLALHIYSRIVNEFGPSYRWITWTFHFVCNPLLLSEGYIMSLVANQARQLLFLGNQLNRFPKNQAVASVIANLEHIYDSLE
jgi:hypothetical protein